MYYFKDHINFTNNLQDNLYILRQRQLKEAAAWSPSSGGPAVPESAAGTNELKDRMRNIKQSGDRQQSKEYLEMEAELNRRTGGGSPDQAAPSQASSSQSAPSQASSSQSSSTSSRSTGTQEWYDPDRQGSRQTSQNQRGVDITQQSPERIDAMNDPARGGQSGRFGNPNAGRGPTTTAQPVSGGNARPTVTSSATPTSTPTPAPTNTGSPTTYRGFDRGDGLAKPETTTSVTPDDAIRARQHVINSHLPNRMIEDEQGARTPSQDPDMPTGSYSPKPEYATPPATPQSSPSTASNPILDQLRKTWKDLGTPRYSPVPQSASPGANATEPQSMGLELGDMAPGQPYVVPGSQNWNNMSHDEQLDMVVRAQKNKEIHKFTGGRDAVDPNALNGERTRFNTDNGSDSFAADINQRSKLANDVIDRQRQIANRETINMWNNFDLDDEKSYPSRPWFWPKVSKTSETPKPAEDTRPTSGRKTIYPGSLQNMIDKMQNKDGSARVFTDRQRMKFSHKPK